MVGFEGVGRGLEGAGSSKGGAAVWWALREQVWGETDGEGSRSGASTRTLRKKNRNTYKSLYTVIIQRFQRLRVFTLINEFLRSW